VNEKRKRKKAKKQKSKKWMDRKNKGGKRVTQPQAGLIMQQLSNSKLHNQCFTANYFKRCHPLHMGKHINNVHKYMSVVFVVPRLSNRSCPVLKALKRC